MAPELPLSWHVCPSQGERKKKKNSTLPKLWQIRVDVHRRSDGRPTCMGRRRRGTGRPRARQEGALSECQPLTSQPTFSMRSPRFIGPICRRAGHRLRRGCGVGPLFRLATGDFRSTGNHRLALNRSSHHLLPRRVQQEGLVVKGFSFPCRNRSAFRVGSRAWI